MQTTRAKPFFSGWNRAYWPQINQKEDRMPVIQFPDADAETQIILVSDLLARTAQKPMTPGNLERVNNLARKVMELTQHPH